MSFIRSFKKLQLLDTLIRLKATGNQESFARKVGICRSMLNQYLNEMKMLGFPISYCRRRKTYFYKQNGRLTENLFQSGLSQEEMQQYKGGKKNINFFHSLNIIDWRIGAL